MKRRHRDFALAVSSLLFVAMALLWARSYVQVEYYWRTGPSGGWCVLLENGSLHLLLGTEDRTGPPTWGCVRFRDRSYHAFGSMSAALGWLAKAPVPGFTWERDPVHGTQSVRVPYMPMVLAAGLWPLWRLIRRDRPAWLRYAAAAAVGLWPSGGLLLDWPDVGAADIVELTESWVVPATIVIGIVVACRAMLEAEGKKRLPWQWKERRALERQRRGRCVECGYDLRAEPGPGGATFDRCPECGSQARSAGGRTAQPLTVVRG